MSESVSNAHVEKMKELISIRDKIEAAEQEVKDLKKDAGRVEQKVLDWFEKSGIQNVEVDGRKLYVRRQMWARPHPDMDKELFFDALKEEGLGDMVKETVSTQTLSGYVRELEREEQPIPEKLAKVIDTYERVSVNMRRS